MPFKGLRFKPFSSAYEYPPSQYPHQSSNGRRELRAVEKENVKERIPSTSRDRTKMNSVDTAIHVPSVNGEPPSDSQQEDFANRYHARRQHTNSDATVPRSKSIYSPEPDHPTSPDFTDMDDGTGQPVAPVDLSKRGIHIPTRTRYEPESTRNIAQ